MISCNKSIIRYILILICYNYIIFSDMGFEVPNKFIVGYALDYNEYFRDLNVSSFSSFIIPH